MSISRREKEETSSSNIINKKCILLFYGTFIVFSLSWQYGFAVPCPLSFIQHALTVWSSFLIVIGSYCDTIWLVSLQLLWVMCSQFLFRSLSVWSISLPNIRSPLEVNIPHTWIVALLGNQKYFCHFCLSASNDAAWFTWHAIQQARVSDQSNLLKIMEILLPVSGQVRWYVNQSESFCLT